MTEFGGLKPRALYAGVAADHRQDLYRAAKALACERLAADLADDRALLASALADELRLALPDYRPTAFADADGPGLTLAGFFEPPAAAAAGGPTRGAVVGVGGGIVLALFALLAAVVRRGGFAPRDRK